jgi:hypothetical protein
MGTQYGASSDPSLSNAIKNITESGDLLKRMALKGLRRANKAQWLKPEIQVRAQHLKAKDSPARDGEGVDRTLGATPHIVLSPKSRSSGPRIRWPQLAVPLWPAASPDSSKAPSRI